MTLSADTFLNVASFLITVLSASIYLERRLTRLETMMQNHLAHHEAFEKILKPLIDKALKD